MGDGASIYQGFQVVGPFSMVVDYLVGSLPIGAQLTL